MGSTSRDSGMGGYHHRVHALNPIWGPPEMVRVGHPKQTGHLREENRQALCSAVTRRSAGLLPTCHTNYHQEFRFT